MTVLYLLFAFVIGFLVCYFALLKPSKLKFELDKTRLNFDIDALKNSQKTTESLCNMVKEEFVNLANSAIIEKTKVLEEANLKKLDTSINPLKERILEFQKKVEEFNIEGVKNTNVIQEQIRSLTNENNQIRMTAENLARALRDNSKSRGLFGEMILENILKASGLEDKKDNPEYGTFITQTGFRALDNPDGAKIMPDAVVYFPDDNKNIVIDSKLPLVDFLGYVEANDEDDKEKSLKQFYKSVEDRVAELSGKYNNLEGLCVPDFTLMFVPVEACMNYIYSNQKIVENAYKKGVVIVGPASLIATLRIVKYAWAQKNQEKNIKEITKLCENIYSKVVTLIEKFESLQKNFSTMNKSFEAIFTTLKGKGGLISQTQKLKTFGISPTSTIDAKYIEEASEETLV